MSMYIYVSKCIFVFLGYGGTGGHPEHARGGDFYSCFDGHVCAYWGGCCEYQPHYLVRNNKERISNLTTEIKEMIAVATDKYTEHKLITLEYQNKNRIEKRFRKGDYVFVLDRTTIPGNSRPLKTKFHPSPYVVIDVRHTTTRVKRIADGFESVYGNDDLKKYDKTSPLFANLPPQISRILLHDFENLFSHTLVSHKLTPG